MPAQSDIENRIDAIISEVKENLSCIVIKLPPDSVQSWIDLSNSVYGRRIKATTDLSCKIKDTQIINVFDDETDWLSAQFTSS
jgi:hypothetical protein